jgi:glycosyltransferase involved in cell wall biosynthesis
MQLVRNGVTHDARVLRAAATQRRAGWTVSIVGVVTDTQRRPASEHDTIPVTRLAPRSIGDLRRGARRSDRALRSPGPPAVAAGGGARSVAARAAARLSRLFATADFYRLAFGAVRSRRPALLHCNDYNTMWVGVAAKVLLGARIVYDSHELWADRNGRPEWRPWLVLCEAFFVRIADVVITASPGYSGELARRYRVPLPAVVRNVPEQVCDPTAPEDPRLLVYVGGLLTGRGLEQAIDGLELLGDVRLRLVGAGRAAYVEALRARAVRRGVQDRVTFAGAVAPQDVPAAAAAGALGLALIQPVCRSYELTLPNKLFEYAAAGIPVLASDLPVMREVVLAAGLGDVVAPADPRAFAAVVRRLLEPDRQLALRAAVRAFTRVHTAEGERRALGRAYERALEGGRTATKSAPSSVRP